MLKEDLPEKTIIWWEIYVMYAEIEEDKRYANQKSFQQAIKSFRSLIATLDVSFSGSQLV